MIAKIAEEEARAKLAEQANAAAAKKAQDEVDALELLVGIIPEGYTETNIVAYINKKAQETLDSASGGSSESAVSVLAALNTYKSENDPKVKKNTEDIAAIVANYLKAADKTELAGLISNNADEILRIDNAIDETKADKEYIDEIFNMYLLNINYDVALGFDTSEIVFENTSTTSILGQAILG